MGEEYVTVGEVSAGEDAGKSVRLPTVDVLTGRAFVTGKSGSGKSVLEGTTVYTDDGRKAIEEVEEGERVLSLNRRTYESEFREVRATISHEASDLLRITLEDGTEVVGTEDHSFLTVEEMEIVPIEGSDVEEGTWMPLAREFPSAAGRSEIDLGKYAPDANNVVVEDDRIRSAGKEGERSLPLDTETGRTIGLFLSEGSFDSKMTVQISATDESVRSFLEEQEFAAYDRTCNRSFSPFAGFLEAEFGRGADGKRLPDWVFDAPEPFRAGLLGGYFDGDGTVNHDSVSVMSKSEPLLRGMRELLRGFGVSTTLREKLTLYDGEQRRHHRLTVDSFHVGRFDDAVELLVPAKAEKCSRVAETIETGDGYNSKDMVPNFGPVLNRAASERGWNERGEGRRGDAASVHHLTRKGKVGRGTYNRLVDDLGIEGRAKAFGESDIQWKRVASIERLDDTRTVYDLDVALNDNFVANGVFVHNSNTASVVAEKLLDRNLGLLVVDTDGEYYGLKEEYEVLHVGADEECDLRVGVEHAEKLASLALERGVPIILDISSFLDEAEARELVKAVARNLFAKEKKLKQPFLMLVEEVHEYIPEGAGIDECGRMLVKVAKRGRKHGLGIVGISQRPADVKKDFITQCDWLVWHRLTWANDTKVAGRVMGSDYRDRLEGLDDGECFLMADWADEVRRVQVERKRTFDAGATPGLEDVERPDLKSVSDDLVDELAEISERREAVESRVAELERELAEREERIEELEAELADARDLSAMAEQFARAMTDRAGTAAAADADSPGGAAAADGPPDRTAVDGTGTARTASGVDGGSVDLDGNGNGPVPDSDGGDADTTGGSREPARSGPATASAVAPPEPDLPPALSAEQRRIVTDLRETLAGIGELPRRMLAHYRARGAEGPVEAHAAVGGTGDRTDAYRHNGTLRAHDLIEHAGRGRYRARLRERVLDAHGDIDPDPAIVAAMTEAVADVLPSPGGEPAGPPER